MQSLHLWQKILKKKFSLHFFLNSRYSLNEPRNMVYQNNFPLRNTIKITGYIRIKLLK